MARKYIQDEELLRFIDMECYAWSTVSADLTPFMNAGEGCLSAVGQHRLKSLGERGQGTASTQRRGDTACPVANAGMVFCDRHFGGINYPKGGVGQIPRAMAEGIEEKGGRIEYKANVKEILTEVSGGERDAAGPSTGSSVAELAALAGCKA